VAALRVAAAVHLTDPLGRLEARRAPLLGWASIRVCPLGAILPTGELFPSRVLNFPMRLLIGCLRDQEPATAHGPTTSATAALWWIPAERDRCLC
jgi:hypothetical protein